MTLTNFAKRAVSGRFFFDVVDNNNDSICVTEGRFDMVIQPQ